MVQLRAKVRGSWFSFRSVGQANLAGQQQVTAGAGQRGRDAQHYSMSQGIGELPQRALLVRSGGDGEIIKPLTEGEDLRSASL